MGYTLRELTHVGVFWAVQLGGNIFCWENSNFLISHVLLEVWYEVLKWFGVSFTIHNEILENLEQFLCLLGEGEL